MKKILLALLISLPLLSSDAFSGREINLTVENTVIFRDEVTSRKSQNAMQKLHNLRLKNPTMPLYLVLDSPGGSIDAGLDLINFVDTMENVHTISMYAASMAHGFAQSIKGKRFVTKSGTMMAHRASVRMSGQISNGEFESRLKMLRQIVSILEKANAKRIGISLEKYKAKVKDEWWCVGKSCVDQNIADEVITIKCSDKLISSREIQTITNFFGQTRVVKYSGCPLFRGPIR